MRALQICLFGRFAASTHRGTVELGEREAQLLAYLALHSDDRVSRVQAAGAIWSDHSDRRARANLSTALWRVRGALSKSDCPPNLVRVSAASLALDVQNCDLDIEDFRRDAPGSTASAISFEGLARAVHAIHLYRGDLLADWDLEWCRLEREELRRHYLTTLRLLTERFERRGRYDLALQFAQKAVAADALDEGAQRSAIRLLSHVGQRTTAIAQFNRFAQLVRDELGVDPAEETVALLGEIRRAPHEQRRAEPTNPWAAPISTEGLPMVGREEECGGLLRLMDQTVDGAGGSALILGDIGTGKTRLVTWAVEEWASRGYGIGLGRCIEFNEPVPYQPLLDALGAEMDDRDVTRLMSDSDRNTQLCRNDESVPASRDDGGIALHWSTRKQSAFARLTARLGDKTRARPLLLVVEDIQWADAGTVDFLIYVLEHARRMRLTLLLTSRPGSSPRHSRTLERLRRHCSTSLRLSPLSRAETTRFIEMLLGEDQVSPWLADWIHDDTEGNPLFVLETMRLFQQRNMARDFTSRAVRRPRALEPNVDRQEIPEGVRAAVEQRLALLDIGSHQVAQIASVLGRGFDEELLDLVIGARGNKLAKALGQLVRTGIFERESTTYRFTHDKLRAVCYEGMPLRAKRAFHARAATALGQMPDVPLQRLAWHQHCAGKWSLAATTWERAGDHAMNVFACEDALSAYRHAISCLRRVSGLDAQAKGTTEMELFLKLDAVLAALGRPAERASCLERVRELCERRYLDKFRPTWYLRRASLEEHVGNFRAASSLSRRAWFLAKILGDEQVEAEALRSLAWALNRSGRHERSAAVSRLALRRLENARSPALVATLWQAAAVHIKISEFSTALAYLDRAENLANALGLVRELYYTSGARAVVDKWTGRIHASRAGFARALQLASEACDRIGQARALFHLATLDAFQGELGASLRKLRKAITLSRSTGYTRTHLACLNNVAYGTGRLLGNYRWAWKAVSHALQLAETSGSRHLAPLCKDSQVVLLIEQGRSQEAMVLTEEVLKLLRHEKETMGPNQESITRRGVIWIQLGEFRKAVGDLELARERQVAMGERLILVDTLTYLAIAYGRIGDPRALGTSEEAIRLLTEIGYANMQPQRIFWHHFQILESLGQTPRLPYLRQAVEAIEAQALTLSRAQQRRFRAEVSVNRTILEAWEHHQMVFNSEPATALSRAP